MTETQTTAPAEFDKVMLHSFGYLHHDGTAPEVLRDNERAVVLDVRRLFRDPHVDPAFRELTGFDAAVRSRVLTQPGAKAWAEAEAAAIAALAADGQNIAVGIGCAGGRHRSVVLVDQIALHLSALWVPVRVRHMDIERPVVERATTH